MENIKEKIFKFLHLDSMISNVSGFVEAKLDLYKLEIRQDIAKVLARAIVDLTIGFFAAMLLIFFSIGLAIFLNKYFSEPHFGYWIVGGMYAVIFTIVLMSRKGLNTWFERRLVDMIKPKQK